MKLVGSSLDHPAACQVGWYDDSGPEMKWRYDNLMMAYFTLAQVLAVQSNTKTLAYPS